MTIWACQAGKDVYVEKPASHNVFEGQRMVEVARETRRMVQVGSQSRSHGHKNRAMRLLGEGVIGQVYMARGLCFRRRHSIGHTPEEPPPPGIDWPQFLLALAFSAAAGWVCIAAFLALLRRVGLVPFVIYRLVLGLADADTEDWLPVVDAEGRIVGSTADLLPVRIEPAATPPSPDALHLAHRSDAAWPAADGASTALRLLGHSAPSHTQAGATIVIETGWTSDRAAAGDPDRDLQVSLSLVQPDGDLALQQTLPLSRYPTSRWRASEVIHELYDLHLPATLPGGTTYYGPVTITDVLPARLDLVTSTAPTFTRNGGAAAGFTVEWHEYPMQHAVCAEEIEDIRTWLLKVFGRS